MRVQPLTTLLEGAINFDSGRNFSGYVTDAQQLLDVENLRALDKRHQGIYALLLFHPKSDKSVREYIKAGSLGSDTGRHVMALFMLDSNMSSSTTIDDSAFKKWIDLSDSQFPIAEFASRLFNNSAMPPLPGIVLLERLGDACEPVFVSIKSTTAAGVRDECRKIFDAASQTFVKTKEGESGAFSNSLGQYLALNGFEYRRDASKSPAEWFLTGVRFAYKNAGTIVSVLKVILNPKSALSAAKEKA